MCLLHLLLLLKGNAPFLLLLLLLPHRQAVDCRWPRACMVCVTEGSVLAAGCVWWWFRCCVRWASNACLVDVMRAVRVNQFSTDESNVPTQQRAGRNTPAWCAAVVVTDWPGCLCALTTVSLALLLDAEAGNSCAKTDQQQQQHRHGIPLHQASPVRLQRSIRDV